MPTFQTFLSDYDDDRHISPDAPVERTNKQARDRFENVTDSEGCFFGMIDEKDNTLQFMWNKDGTLMVDIPIPERDGSYVKKASFDECCEIISSLPKIIDPKLIPGLKFKRWGRAPRRK